jgi:hypothetical protein
MELVRGTFAGTVLALAVVLGACAGATTSTSPAPTCEEAPAYLVTELRSRIATEGVTLDRAYIGPATDLTKYVTERGSTWWWVVGQLGGIDGSVAIWLVSNREEGGTHIYLAANDTALRHSGSDWNIDPNSLGGIPPEIRDCLE